VRTLVVRLSEKEAEELAEKIDFSKGNGLVPVIAQDAATDKVLTQAYMNRQALVKTLTTGKMHYWSRTRGRLWMKGEESQHYSLVTNAIVDCDSDAILFKVQQVGPACHTGAETCFHNPLGEELAQGEDARVLEKVSAIIQERIENPKPDSYVASLVGRGEDAILRKIGEEATELILAGKAEEREHVVGEAADLIFHTLVLLAKRGIPVGRVFAELAARHRAKAGPK